MADTDPHRARVVDALDRAKAPFLLVGGTADRMWDGAVARRLSPHVREGPPGITEPDEGAVRQRADAVEGGDRRQLRGVPVAGVVGAGRDALVDGLDRDRLHVLAVERFTVGHVLEEQAARPDAEALKDFDLAAIKAAATA